MPIIKVRNNRDEVVSDCSVVCFDRDGNECPEKDGKFLSEQLCDELKGDVGHVDDVFVISHGWQGDAIGATEQYSQWIRAMSESLSKQASFYGLPLPHKSLVIGIHWPSRPIGTEDFPRKALESLGTALSAFGRVPNEDFLALCCDGIIDSDGARQAFADIAELMDEDTIVSQNPRESFAFDINSQLKRTQEKLQTATATIIDELDRKRKEFGGKAREGGRTAIAVAADLIKAAAELCDSKLSRESVPAMVINMLSFYQMKQRAHIVGTVGGAKLLTKILKSVNSSTRVHLMGHSFGCIVVSAMLASLEDELQVDSLALIQGALSIWSFSEQVQGMSGAGAYHNILPRVRGAIITTQSHKDTAVLLSYPAAVSILDPERFDVKYGYPDYAGLGSYGVRGWGIPICDLMLKPVTGRYFFRPGMFYNLRSDAAICNGGPPSGAHCDIAKPEVANAVWQAALSSMRSSAEHLEPVALSSNS